jgi:hypothetical protein
MDKNYTKILIKKKYNRIKYLRKKIIARMEVLKSRNFTSMEIFERLCVYYKEINMNYDDIDDLKHSGELVMQLDEK